eukprot:GAHX01003012.1.p1 GENE.GAHX01003012.1~~GAHX01003012.1.p1  ORF type:complete len:479 (-),score=59.14 GAHX01003012.1:432-1868(-)
MLQQSYDTSTFQPTKVRTFQSSLSQTEPKALLRSRSFLDKTKQYLSIITCNPRIILIRPRRFGKTVTLDFLKLIFQGPSSRQYFEGTYIYDQPMIDIDGNYIDERGNAITDKGSAGISKRVIYQWPKHPIIHFDFKYIADEDSKMVKRRILISIYQIAEQYGISDKFEDPNTVVDMATYIKHLILHLTCLGNEYESTVIVLIDEFDAVFRDFNFKSQLEQENVKSLVKTFYNVLKTEDSHIKLKFITGITTVSYTDIFTWSPDTVNISLLPQYATIVGFTKQEIKNNLEYTMFEVLAKNIVLDEKLDPITNKEAIVKLVMDRLEKWYDGYRFSNAQITVYNTLSVIESFNTSNIENHWIYLYSSEKQYKGINENPEMFRKIQIHQEIDDVLEEELFESKTIETNKNIRELALLYQTGLLTIKHSYVENGIRMYTLHFPNKEVRDDYEKIVLDIYKRKVNDIILKGGNTNIMDYFVEEE